MNITYKHEIAQSDTVTKDTIIDIILKNRNITDKTTFVNPPSPLSMHISDFGYTKEIKRTLEILEKLKKSGEMIVVYTDYDADGITGGSILWETLHLLGFKVMPYVPHRQHEGYGFSMKGIDNVREQFNPSLIISVDHGITAREKVTYAKSLGIPVIITDHHLKPDLIPEDAEAIFHIPQLSGSGVSYFFSKMIFEHLSKPGMPNHDQLLHNFSCDYAALASIGTIADLVPLVNQSRALVKFGLTAFRRMKRVGIAEILKQAGIESRPITPYEVGFAIAPRINAIGRLEHAIDALRLICTTSMDRAQELAGKIGKTNQVRQDLVKDSVAEALEVVEAKQKDNKLIIVTSDSWHEGIIGLIASKIVEKYYRPVIVMTKADGFYKGSARSIKGFHLTNFLRGLKEHLIDVGGHEQAAGFSIHDENIPPFLDAAKKKSHELISAEMLVKMIEADMKIPVSKLSMAIARTLEELTPYGIGNPYPTFYSEVELMDAKLMGKTHDHLKLFVRDVGQPTFPLELVAFSKGSLFPSLSRGMTLKVVYKLELDRWGGTEKLKGMVSEIV